MDMDAFPLPGLDYESLYDEEIVLEEDLTRYVRVEDVLMSGVGRPRPIRSFSSTISPEAFG